MEYFYGSESSQYAFFRIPKALFTDPTYSALTTDAKLLYGLMLDRLELSLHNGWFDEQGRAYIYFKREDMMEQLAIKGSEKASKLMQELESVGLIERRRQGLGMPTMIYVGRFVRQQQPPAARTRKKAGAGANPQTFENRTSGRSEIEPPDVRKSNVYNKKSKTEGNKTELSILSDPAPKTDPAENPAAGRTARLDKMGYEEMIRDNIDFDSLAAERPADREVIASFVDLMAGICSSHRQWIRIASDQRPRAEVRRELLRLRRQHIVYVLDSMTATNHEIRNIRSYTLAALYNAPATMATHELKQRREAAPDRNAWMKDYA